jgi:hypothetical protein
MSIPTPPRSLKIGTIVDKTLGVIERSAAPVLGYIAGLTLINGAITYFSRDMTRVTDALVLGLAGIAVGIVAAFLLLEAVVRRTGLRSRTEGDVFLTFCVMSILATLGVFAGFILLVIPGLVIMARWMLAGTMVIARGDGAKQALGESWERTRGAEFPILIAMLALTIGPIVVMIACSFLFDPTDPVGIGISQLATSGMSAVIQMMGVALYGLIVGAPAAAVGLEGAPRS